MSDGKKASNNINVAHVASLAKLKVGDSEKQKLQDDMNEILGYINMLSELNLESVEPTIHACDITNIWRSDMSEKQYIKEYFMANAPAHINRELIKVPQVISGEDET